MRTVYNQQDLQNYLVVNYYGLKIMNNLNFNIATIFREIVDLLNKNGWPVSF